MVRNGIFTKVKIRMTKIIFFFFFAENVSVDKANCYDDLLTSFFEVLSLKYNNFCSIAIFLTKPVCQQGHHNLRRMC